MRTVLYVSVFAQALENVVAGGGDEGYCVPVDRNLGLMELLRSPLALLMIWVLSVDVDEMEASVCKREVLWRRGSSRRSTLLPRGCG